jgi:hypothetical protein
MNHMARLIARPVSMKVHGKPMLRLASGIDYDVLPESPNRGCHLYQIGEKITRLHRQNIADVTDLGFQVLQIPSGECFNADIQADGSSGDWRELDQNLKMLADSGAEALLVSGFHWIPESIRNDPRAVALRCCKHDQEIPIFSIWSEFTYEWLRTCVARFAEHLQPRLRVVAPEIAVVMQGRC